MAAVMRRVRPGKRRARNKAEALSIGNWFAKLTKPKQAAYVKEHPHSIYADKRKAVTKETAQKDGKARIKAYEMAIKRLEHKIAKNKDAISNLLGEGKKARKRMPNEKQSWEYARENMDMRTKIKTFEDRIKRLR